MRRLWLSLFGSLLFTAPGWGGILTPKDYEALKYAQNMPAHKVQHQSVDQLKGKPSEENLYGNSKDLESRSSLHEDYAKNALKESAHTRQHYSFNPAKDPIFKISGEIQKDPEKIMSHSVSTNTHDSKKTTETCFESKPSRVQTCKRVLTSQSVQITPAKYSHFWCTSGNHQPDDPHCAAKKYYEIPKKYKEEVITFGEAQWADGCGDLSKKVKAGLCRLSRSRCVLPNEKREIMASVEGKLESKVITLPCGAYEDVYECSFKGPDTCGPLRERGCVQVHSECSHKIGQECVQWKQTLSCSKRENTLTFGPKVNSKIYFGEDPKSAENHEDFQKSMGQLATLEALQKSIREERGNTTIPQVFKGTTSYCTTAFAGFKECCKGGRGWGVSMGLAGCSEEDKKTVELNNKQQCVDLGEFCAERFLGICIRKKKTFCCYPSKIVRLVSKSGKGQLGIPFGDAENPNCRGFTVDELSKIDFSKIDFQELHEEFQSLMTKSMGEIKKNSKIIVNKMSTSVRRMQASFGGANDVHKTGEY